MLESNTSNSLPTKIYSRSNFCNSIWDNEAIESYHVDSKSLLTKSNYTGPFNIFSMQGKGRYIFPDGDPIYEGDFMDGEFHGYGRLLYSDGTIIYGRWWCGKLISRKIVFNDSILFNDQNWAYLQEKDRRFSIEHKVGIHPAGLSFMINSKVSNAVQAKRPKELKKGLYDTVDGLYCSKRKVVFDVNDNTIIRRVPEKHETMWIHENCRKREELYPIKRSNAVINLSRLDSQSNISSKNEDGSSTSGGGN